MCQLQTNVLWAQDSMEVFISEKASEEKVYSPFNVILGHPKMQVNVMQQDCFL